MKPDQIMTWAELEVLKDITKKGIQSKVKEYKILRKTNPIDPLYYENLKRTVFKALHSLEASRRDFDEKTK